MRYENWKFVFEEQRAPGTIRIWAEPFTKLRVPKLFDLHADPYERADITSNTYYDWFISNAGIVYGGIAVADNFLQHSRSFRRASTPQPSRLTRRLTSSNIA